MHARRQARARACMVSSPPPLDRLHAEQQQQQHTSAGLQSSPAFESPFSASRLVLDTKSPLNNNSGGSAPGIAFFRSANQQRFPSSDPAAAIPLLSEVQHPSSEAAGAAAVAASPGVSSMWTVSKKDVLRRRQLRQATAESGLTPPPHGAAAPLFDARNPEDLTLAPNNLDDPSEQWPRFGADSPIFQLNNSPARQQLLQQQQYPNARSLSRSLFGSLRAWGTARPNASSGGGAMNNAAGDAAAAAAATSAAALTPIGSARALMQPGSTSPVPETPEDAPGEAGWPPKAEPGEKEGKEGGRAAQGSIWRSDGRRVQQSSASLSNGGAPGQVAM
jgi:hypothetical protein